MPTQFNFNADDPVPTQFDMAMEIYNRTDGANDPVKTKSAFMNRLVSERFWDLVKTYPEVAQRVAEFKGPGYDPMAVGLLKLQLEEAQLYDLVRALDGFMGPTPSGRPSLGLG